MHDTAGAGLGPADGDAAAVVYPVLTRDRHGRGLGQYPGITLQIFHRNFQLRHVDPEFLLRR
ncbi:hypothetical protein A4E84_36720 [Streptomyces qaidamensis]|uniref:Uncharacterized protein n=1 Tax=Streptomyces qaidamensis TaxID=1783515 RepID=A0A143CBT6_9ACTN|nr:hypothetical protein A4E84_36720 [Streptomyces qaidamensis]